MKLLKTILNSITLLFNFKKGNKNQKKLNFKELILIYLILNILTIILMYFFEKQNFFFKISEFIIDSLITLMYPIIVIFIIYKIIIIRKKKTKFSQVFNSDIFVTIPVYLFLIIIMTILVPTMYQINDSQPKFNSSKYYNDNVAPYTHMTQGGMTQIIDEKYRTSQTEDINLTDKTLITTFILLVCIFIIFPTLLIRSLVVYYKYFKLKFKLNKQELISIILVLIISNIISYFIFKI